MKKHEVYEKLKKNPKSINFQTLCEAAELFGFRFRGEKGSHRIYIKKGIQEMLNFQNVKGEAKDYQVKQFIRIIEKHNLLENKDV
jgi:predicted RNA binding protein YcfA (HicA-like mRNA interferase family)